ncbi:NADP-dependent oxidoreductase [Flavobacterium cerinum]|uniref:NADP-dependent oxidoreductase n=1 Tax=Flavobacterium cerinum TaxID=2502784 RepID=A0A444HC85_9FLAO|nr:NADP-dependent oxidoreductase [Flavobacterium cerinum]RWX01388.1 NADP-dependent oxidoreductase [Flavobacterium cerinum]
MKAIVLNNKGDLNLEEVLIPMPKDNEVQVKIMASGFNPIDYQMIENELERKLLHSPILGREFSGIVTTIGNKVINFKIGDAVFCGSGSMGSNGTYAEYINVPEEIVAVKPDSISFEEAAAIPSAGLTALQCFDRIPIDHLSTLFITGAAGGVGAMLIKILLTKGYRNFIVTAGNETSIGALLEIGVQSEQIINYTLQDVGVAAITLNNNSKFDIVVDLVGGAIAEKAAGVLKTNGAYLDVTALSTPSSREILFNKGAIIINISNYAYVADKNYVYYKAGLTYLASLLHNSSITPPSINVLGGLDVDTALKAHNILKTNKTQGRKLIMQIR